MTTGPQETYAPAAPDAAADSVVKEPPSPVRRRRRIYVSEPVLLAAVLVVVSILIATRSPQFLTASNIIVILQNVAVAGIIAVPAVFLLISGNVDLSIGGVATLTGMCLAWASQNMGPVPAVVLSLALGLAIGAVNAILVTVCRINALIATLGMFIILPAIALLGPTSIPINGFLEFGTGRFLGLPVSVILLVITCLVGTFFLSKTRFGRHTFASGANPEASRLAGIRPKRVVAILFLASGLLAGLGGVVQTAEIGQGNPYGNQLLMFYVLTAVVLGGAGLEGGRGSMLGAFIGLVLLGVLDNGLVLIDAPSQYGQILRGVLLLIAVGVSGYRRGRRA